MKEMDAFSIWSRYSIIEDAFIDFLKYVPYIEKHKDVSSPYLDDLLIRACVLLESFFKSEIDSDFLQSDSKKKESGIDTTTLNKLKTESSKERPFIRITDYFQLYDPYYNLSSKHVYYIYPIFNEAFCPFDSWVISKEDGVGKCGLKWWNVYNQLKHNAFSESEDKPTLSIVRSSLGALFLAIIMSKNMYHFLISNGIISAGGLSSSILHPLMIDYYPYSTFGNQFSHGISARSKCFGYIYQSRSEDENSEKNYAKRIFTPPYKGYDD